VIRERISAWVHRECRRDRGITSALLTVGEQLGALTGGFAALRRSLESVPQRVTVIAYGQREAGEPTIVVDSKTVRLQGERNGETITLEALFPIRAFQVVVLADFDRVEVQGVFHRTDLLGAQSPIAFGKAAWNPGEQVRAVVRRLEVGA
jgi:hypothetical protein